MFLNNRRNLSDIAAELIILLCVLSHIILIVLRGVGVIAWSWWIVLIPELFVAAGVVEFMMLLLLSVFQDRRKGRIG